MIDLLIILVLLTNNSLFINFAELKLFLKEYHAIFSNLNFFKGGSSYQRQQQRARQMRFVSLINIFSSFFTKPFKDYNEQVNSF